MNEESLTTEDVARALGISTQRVRRLVSDGRLTPLRRVRGAYLFSAAVVANFGTLPRHVGRPRKPSADAPATEGGNDGE